MEPVSAASAITTVLQGAGFLGVAILALGWVCITLYKAYKEVQDKRVADAQDYARSMQQAVETVKENTAAMNRMADIWNGKNR